MTRPSATRTAKLVLRHRLCCYISGKLLPTCNQNGLHFTNPAYQSIVGFFIAQMLNSVSAIDDVSTLAMGAAKYGGAWQKARAGFLRSHPLCKDHHARGMVVEATVVDHVVPHRGDNKLFWAKSNWQSLCKQCHDGWKQRQEKGAVTGACSVSGLPLDPRHPWMQSSQAEAGGGGKSLDRPASRPVLSLRSQTRVIHRGG